MKNRYFIRSRIAEKKFREIIRLFSADLTVQQIAFLSKSQLKIIEKLLKKMISEPDPFKNTQSDLTGISNPPQKL